MRVLAYVFLLLGIACSVKGCTATLDAGGWWVLFSWGFAGIFFGQLGGALWRRG